MDDSAAVVPRSPAQSLPAPRRRSVLLRIVVWALVLAVFAVGFYFVLNRQPEAKAAPRRGPGGPATVVPATATKGDINVYLSAIGTVTPIYTASITGQVNGVITEVHYQEGQVVKVGDPLIDIDPRPYQATLLQAQGILQRDENVLGQAKMDMDRYNAAWARNAIAKQILDDQQKIVLQDEGTVKNDQGIVQYDQVQVDYCHITSPIAGRVGLRLVDPGNLAQASATSTPLAVITQVEPISVIFTIPEDSLAAVLERLRAKAELTIDAFDRSAQKKLASGTLLAVDNQIDTTTGTVKARALFKNEDEALFPNQFVNTRLLLQTLQGVTLIPASAVQQNGQSAFVYVIQDNVVHMREVHPGVTDNGVTQVDGIKPGEVVANSGFDKLQDNDPITLAPAAGAGGRPGGGPGGHPGGGHPGGSPGAGRQPGGHKPDAAGSSAAP